MTYLNQSPRLDKSNNTGM